MVGACTVWPASRNSFTVGCQTQLPWNEPWISTRFAILPSPAWFLILPFCCRKDWHTWA